MIAAAAVMVLASACTRNAGLPSVPSEQYEKLCSAFYLGLAALQSGEDVNARKGLVEATRIAPAEPASWLNLGLLQFRQQDFEGAYQSVARALTLVDGNSRVEALLGVIESRRGKEAEAIAHLTRAVELDNHNLKAAFALAQETERQNSATSDEAAQKLTEKILSVQPNNIAVLLEDVRLAAKRGDGARAKAAVATLASSADVWPEPARQQLASLQKVVDGDVHAAAIQAQFLKNVLVRAPAYRQSLDDVRTPATSAGEPFLKFFKLPSPRSEPDERDSGLRFERIGNALEGDIAALVAVSLDHQSAPVPVALSSGGAHVGDRAAIPFPSAGAVCGPESLAAADFNYDFKTDFAIACSKGLRIFEQSEGGGFHDVTAAAKLPAAVVNASYFAAWAFDYDLDGDLDLVLSSGNVLRNNGDGTFEVANPFPAISNVKSFASADVDGDGDADVALISGEGQLTVFANDRLGDYRPRTMPDHVARGAQRVTSADVNGDGLTDFVVASKAGVISRLSDAGAGKEWKTAQLASVREATSLSLADLDNNGALDLLAGTQIFLGDGKAFIELIGGGWGRIADAADLDGDGRLELLTANGTWRSRGTKDYHWQTVRPLAARTNGDQRMNSFGIGGEIEIRADLLTQKQIVRGPSIHFGMGSHSRGTEFARIAWPNGLIQTEFNLKPDQTLVAEQRLKGSCPYLFAWDGKTMRFVKDVAPMSAALGAHDGAGHPAQVGNPNEWFSIPGSRLQADRGRLRLSVTDEYWESYFIDRYELMAVDHPQGSQMFVDERVAVPAVQRRVILTGPSHDFAAVRVEKFLSDTYAGIGREHSVEMTLPAGASADTYLIARASLKPWDDMTLVAMGQGSRSRPQELSLDIWNERTGWRTVRSNLGVPAGREKTMVIDLRGVLPPGNGAKTLRLRTNLAIDWQKLEWAEPWRGEREVKTKLVLERGTLRHRGFSKVTLNRTGIEYPAYPHPVESGDRWPSLDGYYTRFGDVLPLVSQSDGRFAILASGDELQLEFRGTPHRENSIRDYVFAGDGWIKEGDPSFRGSQSLLPLPYPGITSYSGHPAGVENERAYRQHPEDWQNFHTRYLTGETMRTALWPRPEVAGK